MRLITKTLSLLIVWMIAIYPFPFNFEPRAIAAELPQSQLEKQAPPAHSADEVKNNEAAKEQLIENKNEILTPSDLSKVPDPMMQFEGGKLQSLTLLTVKGKPEVTYHFHDGVFEGVRFFDIEKGDKKNPSFVNFNIGKIESVTIYQRQGDFYKEFKFFNGALSEKSVVKPLKSIAIPKTPHEPLMKFEGDSQKLVSVLILTRKGNPAVAYNFSDGMLVATQVYEIQKGDKEDPHAPLVKIKDGKLESVTIFNRDGKPAKEYAFIDGKLATLDEITYPKGDKKDPHAPLSKDLGLIGGDPKDPFDPNKLPKEAPIVGNPKDPMDKVSPPEKKEGAFTPTLPHKTIIKFGDQDHDPSTPDVMYEVFEPEAPETPHEPIVMPPGLKELIPINAPVGDEKPKGAELMATVVLTDPIPEPNPVVLTDPIPEPKPIGRDKFVGPPEKMKPEGQRFATRDGKDKDEWINKSKHKPAL